VRRLIAYVRYVKSLVSSRGQSSEFHYFPFDTTKPMPKGAEDVMVRLCDILEEMGIRYRITDGTVLGLYRDKGFIPHDNDIDVDVLDCADVTEIEVRMRSAGMKLGRRVSQSGKIQQLTYYDNNFIIFDLIFWFSESDKILNYSEPGYLRTQPITYFSELGELSWNGHAYPVPAHLEEWLAFRYGEDWNVPKHTKDDWKLECHDLVKL
jgi:hypothetical protein